MKVIVASTNPIKIQATQKGFNAMFGEDTVFVEGTRGSSGVSDQPMTNDETYQGAKNRVERIQNAHPDADFWVGIEGGLERNQNGQLDAFAWVVVHSKEKGTSHARSASFTLPPKIATLIDDGYELGAANDIVFKQENTKQKAGAVGLLTHNAISRADLYAPAVTLALISFANPELYNQKNS